MKHVGINVPLFSLRSGVGWGIGELTDIEPFAEWLASARVDRLLLLPLGTMQPGQTSPYSALSTLAIDPLYIGLTGLDDFEQTGGIASLSAPARDALDAARRSPAVDYDAVRTAKTEALDRAFEHFLAHDWLRHTGRADALAAYLAREAWWVDDYALFQALVGVYGTANWRDWPEPVRERDDAALDAARRDYATTILRHEYLQWVAEDQWQRARARCRTLGVALFGDLPFVASADSPEIWARAGEFMLDVSTGVPPDAFSETGQDWGLPTYRWDVIRDGGYDWLRHRSRRMAALFDGLRVDHTIGLYRTYGRPLGGGEPFFTPGDEPTQIAQGEQILRLLLESGLELVAEDLGVIPDFLRDSLARLGVPGCRVFRWERDWHAPDQPFIEPACYPARSAAMTGTHDTEALAVWWDDASPEERGAALQLSVFRERGIGDRLRPWDNEIRDVLLELAYRAGSAELFLPIQDVFGWRDRVNVPATVGPHNWTWSLPWPVDGLDGHAEARDGGERLSGLARGTERGRPDGGG